MADQSQTTVVTKAQLDAATQAVYDCDIPAFVSPLAVLLHLSDYIDASAPIEGQLEQVRAICRTIARAALEAAANV